MLEDEMVGSKSIRRTLRYARLSDVVLTDPAKRKSVEAREGTYTLPTKFEDQWSAPGSRYSYSSPALNELGQRDDVGASSTPRFQVLRT